MSPTLLLLWNWTLSMHSVLHSNLKLYNLAHLSLDISAFLDFCLLWWAKSDPFPLYWMLLTWLFSVSPGTSLVMPQASSSIVLCSLADKDLQSTKQADHGILHNYKTRAKPRREKATRKWEGKEEEECNAPWSDWPICFLSASIHISPGTNWAVKEQ